MAENNQKVVKYDLVKEIISKYDPEILKWLKDNNYKYRIRETKDLIPYQLKEEINEELPFVEVDPEIYQKLKKLSEITNIPIEDIVSAELRDFFYSVSGIPVIFLDRHLGIENIENPIEILEKMKGVINIGEKHFEWLKTQDLVKHVEEWNNPLKDFKKSN